MSTDAPRPPTSSRFARLLQLTARIEDALLVLLLGAMLGLAGLQILLRNLWDSGLAWSDPLLRVLVLWLGLLGAMAATRDDRHITIDVLSRLLAPRARLVVHSLTDLFTITVCALLAWHGARFVYLDWQDGTLAFAAVPAWACGLIIPLGFGLIALRCLCGFLQRLQRFPGRPS